MLLAIETSCDESAVALFDEQGGLVLDLVSSQVELHVPYGGVVPELAARAHLSNLPALIDEIEHRAPGALSKLTAVAVTQGPGLKGCLLVGFSLAKGLAYRAGIPVLPVNHLEGHLLAGDLLGTEAPQFPFVALLVSGGHSLLVHVEGFRKYRILAETRDDAVGEAFDKCATLLGLFYPGGPALSQLASRGDALSFSFPIGLPKDSEGFSFSGLKTAFAREISKHRGKEIAEQTRCDLAASIEHALVESLVPKTVYAAQQLGVKSVLVTGGVAANRRLREELSKALGATGIRSIVLPQKWCGDNAAMIGCVGQRLLREPSFSKKDQNWFSLDVRPRFPLEAVSGNPV